jgi:hypothetical protein
MQYSNDVMPYNKCMAHLTGDQVTCLGCSVNRRSCTIDSNPTKQTHKH